MDDFANAKQSKSLSVKLWRGERMCLVGMDVNGPEPDLVGCDVHKTEGHELAEPAAIGLALTS